jgi:hypothetical protein
MTICLVEVILTSADRRVDMTQLAITFHFANVPKQNYWAKCYVKLQL